MMEHRDIVEYWKSSPYLLNFMDQYKFKESFKTRIAGSEGASVAKILKGCPEITLSWDEVSAYGKIDPSNARLKQLLDDTVGKDLWKLLWIPPSFSYYKLDGPYKDIDAKRVTKRLVFSSWYVVPKVISGILSYEAERRMQRSFGEAPENTTEYRKKQRPLLRFAFSGGRLTGMPILSLLYPSFSLARLGDPLEFYKNSSAKPDGGMEISELISDIGKRVDGLLSTLKYERETNSREDEAWYWVAPVLMDMQEDAVQCREWLGQSDLSSRWAGEGPDSEEEDSESRWTEHIAKVREVLSGEYRLGPPPKDLALVLSQMAVAGPAICVLRALCRVSGGLPICSSVWLRNQAAKTAWGFRKLFNQPEVMALLRGMNSEEPYWRRVIEYCLHGGLQAVLDEYVHLLRELLGVDSIPTEDASEQMGDHLQEVLMLMTSGMDVDDVSLAGKGKEVLLTRRNMRGHFALRFGIQRQEGGIEATREDLVRGAFNSPFWPFVLASTSIGQEGLDFHPYCHAVVHWNLPSNPVDLEQREGRIFRYKGHAVRKNVVEIYSKHLVGDSIADPWEYLFKLAEMDHGVKSRELVPYWIFHTKDGSKIERHVPVFPLSRDQRKLHALRMSLAVYRLVFGQARQEDLVEYLVSHVPENQIQDYVKKLTIKLSPRRKEIDI
jgi:hypothetical protein